MRIIISFLIIFLFGTQLLAQELNCSVQVLSQQVQGTDKRVFETLRTSIFEFMNNTKWTSDAFKNDERIECSIMINISDRVSTDEFKAAIQIQSRRPIYKASYNSVLCNYNDNEFQFKYLEYQPLEFSETMSSSNLTSVLAYYAYMIIGMDYDSFSLNGGSKYFQKAQTVVNNAQNLPEKGWKAYENTKNRYWLVENMIDPVFAPLRECVYQYHLKGLDAMVENKDIGREAIIKSIELLQKVHSSKPASFNMQVFFNAKADELVNIFSQAFPEEKSKIVNILNEIDAANTTKYQKILSAK